MDHSFFETGATGQRLRDAEVTGADPRGVVAARADARHATEPPAQRAISNHGTAQV